MAPPTPVSALKLVAGHLALDFVNTVGDWFGGPDRDSLLDAGELISWAARLGVVDTTQASAFQRWAAASPESAARLLRDARKLRATIHAIFSAVATGRPTNPADVAELASAAAHAMARRRLSHHDGAFVWSWAGSDQPATILDRIAHAAAELLVGASGVRIKECPGQTCGWLFIDSSKNGRRRWCAEADCGTRERVRAYRERNKT